MESFSKTKVVLMALFATAAAVDQAKANDGKISLADAPLLIGPAMQIPSAIAAAKEALVEFQTADTAAKTELANWLTANFDIVNDRLEQQIESVLIGLAFIAGAFTKPATKVS